VNQITAALVMSVGALSACASLFFCYYTLRLAYLGATGRIDAAHRTAGLHIGAAVFPIASFSFGWISLACFNSARFKRVRSPSTAARTRTAIPSGWDSES
jgi:ABC-type Na+ efflux pump permease subunit